MRADQRLKTSHFEKKIKELTVGVSRVAAGSDKNSDMDCLSSANNMYVDCVVGHTDTEQIYKRNANKERCI